MKGRIDHAHKCVKKFREATKECRDTIKKALKSVSDKVRPGKSSSIKEALHVRISNHMVMHKDAAMKKIERYAKMDPEFLFGQADGL